MLLYYLNENSDGGGEVYIHSIIGDDNGTTFFKMMKFYKSKTNPAGHKKHTPQSFERRNNKFSKHQEF